MAPINSGDDKRNIEGFIVEIRQLGDYLKATAVDTMTGIEASVVASPKLTKHQVMQLAARKLKYVLAKKSGSELEELPEFETDGNDTIV